LLADVGNQFGDRQLIDLVKDQLVFDQIVLETMRKGVHYGREDRPSWWMPLGVDRTVTVHPARAVGAPVVMPGGIRTRILYGSYRAEGSCDSVAHWYDVSPQAVTDAVEFEVKMRAAA
jgi:uncharacterized protein (DUF433 family)